MREPSDRSGSPGHCVRRGWKRPGWTRESASARDSEHTELNPLETRARGAGCPLRNSATSLVLIPTPSAMGTCPRSPKEKLVAWGGLGDVVTVLQQNRNFDFVNGNFILYSASGYFLNLKKKSFLFTHRRLPVSESSGMRVARVEGGGRG